MKTILTSTAVIALLTGVALAQTTTTTAPGTTTRQTTTTTTTTTVSPAQETEIRQYVTKQKRRAVSAPSGFTVSTGAVLPEAVEVYELPSDVGVTGYRYTVIGDQTVLIGPDRKIIRVID